MRSKILYTIGIWCGLVPLTVGLAIFFIWWTARAFYAINLDNFEIYGFIWILISIIIASSGLVLVTIFFFQNYKSYPRQSILGLFLILINIPISYAVIIKTADIKQRAYIKIYNNSKQDNIELILKASYFGKKLGHSNTNHPLVDFYYPRYLNERDHDSSPQVDSVFIIVIENSRIHNLILPYIQKGDCWKLYIDDKFRLGYKLD